MVREMPSVQVQQHQFTHLNFFSDWLTLSFSSFLVVPLSFGNIQWNFLTLPLFSFFSSLNNGQWRSGKWDQEWDRTAKQAA